MNSVDKAIQFTACAHDGQYRKGTDIPYITHPFTVSMMLQKEGATVEQVVAGFLHDTVEDTDVTYSIVEKEFGEEIANLVRACSESDKSAS
ncbi:HD domain-containing protein [Bacillus coahuilensis]|uniref:HD domain-containing protein n=1 Tax=Bacillus coahuilensis TaxID=408580 RepID=UPI000185120E|nr:HD domain-containing protein [Bacillus coahuilensis]